ncbi:MAG: glycine--tRNA ligase [Bacteroidetes bacterium]|nr:glycine--tRNA ligase [Bacteroidota bacterium]
MNEDLLKIIISHCKEYGFIFPSSEIYDGTGAVYDYGPNGVELKNNLRNYWWKAMVQEHANIVGIDAAIFMHPAVWKASGHVDAFKDPLIDNKDSKKRYRADTLIEEYVEKQEEKINKEVEKARKRFGEKFDEKLFIETNPRITEIRKNITTVNQHMKDALEANDLPALQQIIMDCEISDPVSGTKNWTEVRQFNLMFETSLGAIAEESEKIYLRPETAQGIFVNFLNVQRSARMKIPFGIAQTGKAFRNEIVARQFIFRMREFEQMEMQFFVKPGEEMEWYQYWKTERMKWHHSLFAENKLRFHDHLKLAHYANAACDIEFEFPMGFKELEGIHSRTDFDLKNHEKYSGKKLQYFNPDDNSSFVPFVVETSIGLDRMFLAVLANAYQKEKLPARGGSLPTLTESDTRQSHRTGQAGAFGGDDGSERIVLRIPPFLAPRKIAVFPLVDKDGFTEKAKEIFDELKNEFLCFFEAKDTIGRRYRRMDAIGTPYCITVDGQTLEDNTVTIRERDTMKQERIHVQVLKKNISGLING